MGSSAPRSRLTPLQRDLLHGFFRHEKRFFLTGGGALAGFYFGHRETEDIDLFSSPGPDLVDATRAVEAAAAGCGATIEKRQVYVDFRRVVATRGAENCVVDLVIDRAPVIDEEKVAFGEIRVDTLREITANKICTLVSRSEIKDLVDLYALLDAGGDLARGFQDAEKKDVGADPATLAWILSEITISPKAALPGGFDPTRLIQRRDELVAQLRVLAFARVRRES